MAIVFEDKVKVTLNRHRFMGDGIALNFSEFTIFSNTSGKYSLQTNYQEGIAGHLVGSDYESATDAYIAAQVHLGKLELKDGVYIPK